jgi:hypothetical protein
MSACTWPDGQAAVLPGDQPVRTAALGCSDTLRGRCRSLTAYAARNRPPAANTMSPGTRSHASVSITRECTISGERAYHDPWEIDAAAW